jgi:L-fuculose-phosphate aldolase
MLFNNKIKKEIISLSKEVSKYCVGMEGNVSGKLVDTLFIKSSGSFLKKLTKKDLVKFDFNGNQMDNFKKKGSMELGFHTFLLGHKNINFISHTHPTKTLSILSGNNVLEFANERIFPDQVIFNGEKSCVVPYAKPGDELTQLIKTNVTQFINENNRFPKLILLQNHGIITCGSTIEECIIISDICEKSAEIYLSVSNIKFLSKKDITNLLDDEKEKYRKSLIWVEKG